MKPSQIEQEAAMNTMTNPNEIIQRAFPGILENEAEEMARTGAVRTYPQGTILCREGAIGSTFYIILEGRVEVTKVINDSEVRLLKVLESGDFFGEIALIHNAPRAATVTTLTPVIVLEINKEPFDGLLHSSTTVAVSMIRFVSRRLRENDEMAIGDLRLKARELAEAYQQLAEMDFARREFLTTIAHELRTPLMAASGYLQAIRMGMIQGDMLNTALDTVGRNIQEITSLVNDILFLQEMDLIFTDFQPTDISAVVSSAVEQQRFFAQNSQVALSLILAPGLPLVRADQKSLERAVAAIVNNGIKFSPNGGDVVVDVSSRDSQVLIKVCDRGVGIPPEAMARIYDRFFHLDQIGGHLFRGVGLGLSIARQVIEQHGGRIEVESELGKGSTFTICLDIDGRR